MKLPYREYRSRPIQNTSSVTVWRPVAPIVLRGTLGMVKLNALVDCGADHTMLPRQFADALGIAIDEDRAFRVRGIGNSAIYVHPGIAEIEIRGD
jgi:hypothetical protein